MCWLTRAVECREKVDEEGDQWNFGAVLVRDEKAEACGEEAPGHVLISLAAANLKP
jgi:hypothetical protein